MFVVSLRPGHAMHLQSQRDRDYAVVGTEQVLFADYMIHGCIQGEHIMRARAEPWAVHRKFYHQAGCDGTLAMRTVRIYTLSPCQQAFACSSTEHQQHTLLSHEPPMKLKRNNCAYTQCTKRTQLAVPSAQKLPVSSSQLTVVVPLPGKDESSQTLPPNTPLTSTT